MANGYWISVGCFGIASILGWTIDAITGFVTTCGTITMAIITWDLERESNKVKALTSELEKAQETVIALTGGKRE